MSNPQGVVVPNLPNVVESVQDVSHDERQIMVSHLLGETSDVLDDSGLRQLIENVPVEFGTELEEERYGSIVKRVSVGQFTENVTFLDNAMDLESGNWTSTPSKDVVHAGDKRKAKASQNGMCASSEDCCLWNRRWEQRRKYGISK